MESRASSGARFVDKGHLSGGFSARSRESRGRIRRFRYWACASRAFRNAVWPAAFGWKLNGDTLTLKVW